MFIIFFHYKIYVKIKKKNNNIKRKIVNATFTYSTLTRIKKKVNFLFKFPFHYSRRKQQRKVCTINKQDNKRARINFSPHLSLRLSSKLSLHNRGSRIPDRCTISARRGSGADFETHFHAFHYSSTVITPFSNITRLVSPAKTINRVHDAIHFAQPPTISPPPPYRHLNILPLNLV